MPRDGAERGESCLWITRFGSQALSVAVSSVVVMDENSNAPAPLTTADIAAIIEVMKGNTKKAQRLILNLARTFPREHPPCPIGSDRALDVAIITRPEQRDPALMAKLDAVAGRVLKNA